MNICLIIDDYLPGSIKVGAKMMHELGLELQSQGHRVMVVTPEPTLRQRQEISKLDGITVCRFRSGEIKNTSKIKRAINETLLSFWAWWFLRRYFKSHPQDLIVYYSPSIFWGPLVSKLKKLWGARSYLVLRDFFPQWVLDNGMLSESSPITAYFRFFERISYKAADTIGIQSPKNLEVFKEMAGDNWPLDLLYNWASDTPAGKTGDYKSKLGLEDKVVFFYGGNIGHAQDMMNIVRLAQAMTEHKQAHFVLVGSGDEVGLVQEAIDKGLVVNLTLLPSVSQSEYVSMLTSFDVGLFSLHPSHTAHNFPGKLLGYMLEQKPILGSVNPDNDLKQVIEEAGAGFISVNGEDGVLLGNALRLLADADLRSSTGAKGRELLSNTFSVSASARRLLEAKAS